MLQMLRSAAAGWVAKVLIGLLVISFAIFGVGNSIFNSGGDVVASVGDTDVPLSRFSGELNREINQVSQQLGQPLTLQQASLFGLPSQVLSRLMSEATLDNRTQAYRMGLSDERLIEVLRNDPLFARAAGFDRAQLQQILRDYQMTEDEYVELYEELAKRRQLADAIVADVQTPQIILQAINEFGKEKRAVDYLVLTKDQIDPVEAPADDVLSTYFEENKNSYRAPEYRSVGLLTLAPQDIARPDEVTEETAKARYEATINQFTSPERRQILQIVVQGDEKIAELNALSAQGLLFSEIAEQLNLTAADLDLGLKAKSEIVDEKVADAVFALRNGQVSEPVTGTFGTYLLKVTAIYQENVKSYEEVADQLKLELALQTATDEMQDLFDSLENDRAGGSGLQELATSYNLPFTEIAAIDANGNGKDEQPVTLPESQDLLSNIFQSDVGVENNALPLPSGYVFYDVLDVEPSRDRTLDEVKDKVTTAWTAAQVSERLAAKAESLRERAAGGVTIVQLAEELGATVTAVEDITRANAAGSDLPQSGLSAIFGGKLGHVAVLNSQDEQSRFLVAVTSVTPAPALEQSSEQDVQKERLSGNLSENLLSQYIGQIQSEEGIEINQQLLQAVLQPQNNPVNSN